MPRASPSRLSSFEEYHDRMLPWVKRLARHRAYPHAYLGQDDLMQEGLMALWNIWQRHHSRLPSEDICRLGTRAMVCRMLNVQARACRRGEAQATVYSLNAPRAGSEEPLALVGHGQDDLDLTMVWVDLRPLHSELEAVAQGRVKHPATVRAICARARQQLTTCGYTLTETEMRQTHQSDEREEETMNDLERGTMPVGPVDDTELPPRDDTQDNPEKEEEAAVATETTKGKTKKGKTKKAAAPKAVKGKAEKAPKGKVEKKAKTPKVPKEKLNIKVLAVGTTVKYLGGSRAEWLKKGAELRIVHVFPNEKDGGVRYGVRFGAGKDAKNTILSHKYVEAK